MRNPRHFAEKQIMPKEIQYISKKNKQFLSKFNTFCRKTNKTIEKPKISLVFVVKTFKKNKVFSN